jgi:hypothetical protein
MTALGGLTASIGRAGGARPHEITVGAGEATSWEKNVFNLPSDFASEPKAFYHLAYRHNVGPRLAWGLHVYGTEERVGDYVIEDPTTGARAMSFDLTTFNYGVHARWSFRETNPRVYVTTEVSGTQGYATAGNTELEYEGFSLGAGPGVQWVFGRRIGLAVEGIASFGDAQWKHTPFANSTSRDFNPSVAGVFASLSYHWGEPLLKPIAPPMNHANVPERAPAPRPLASGTNSGQLDSLVALRLEVLTARRVAIHDSSGRADVVVSDIAPDGLHLGPAGSATHVRIVPWTEIDSVEVRSAGRNPVEGLSYVGSLLALVVALAAGAAAGENDGLTAAFVGYTVTGAAGIVIEGLGELGRLGMGPWRTVHRRRP